MCCPTVLWNLVLDMFFPTGKRVKLEKDQGVESEEGVLAAVNGITIIIHCVLLLLYRAPQD